VLLLNVNLNLLPVPKLTFEPQALIKDAVAEELADVSDPLIPWSLKLFQSQTIFFIRLVEFLGAATGVPLWSETY